MCQTQPRKTSGNTNGSKWIVPERRLALYIRDGFACVYCGEDLRCAPACEVTLDHLTPRCEGGGNESANLITACRSCNSGRGDRPWKLYATGGAVERIRRQIRRKVNLSLAKAILNGTAGDPRVEAAR
jgi:5-methylcytosine-specific restriction endonuclease McrA